jgi:hypothetical protein
MSRYNTKEVMPGQQNGGGAWAARWQRGHGAAGPGPKGPEHKQRAQPPMASMPSCCASLTSLVLKLNIIVNR